VASMVILQNQSIFSRDAGLAVDLDALAHWLACRQMPAEGGFQVGQIEYTGFASSFSF
jgi:hypothetical protein